MRVKELKFGYYWVKVESGLWMIAEYTEQFEWLVIATVEDMSDEIVEVGSFIGCDGENEPDTSSKCNKQNVSDSALNEAFQNGYKAAIDNLNACYKDIFD